MNKWVHLYEIRNELIFTKMVGNDSHNLYFNNFWKDKSHIRKYKISNILETDFFVKYKLLVFKNDSIMNPEFIVKDFTPIEVKEILNKFDSLVYNKVTEVLLKGYWYNE